MSGNVGKFGTVLLWLFVINLGIALGAGLYEARIVVPEWVDTTTDSAQWHPGVAADHDTGRRFWVAVTTVPLTLLTLANLFAARSARGPLRRWWLGAAAIALADRIFTLAYFVPTMLRLVDTPNSPAAAARAVQWATLNHVRHVLVALAFLAALQAFALLHAQRRG